MFSSADFQDWQIQRGLSGEEGSGAGLSLWVAHGSGHPLLVREIALIGIGPGKVVGGSRGKGLTAATLQALEMLQLYIPQFQHLIRYLLNQEVLRLLPADGFHQGVQSLGVFL